MRNCSSPGRRFVGWTLSILCLPLLVACEAVTEPLVLEIRSGLQVGDEGGKEITLHDGENSWTTTTNLNGIYRFRIRADEEPEADAFLWMTTEAEVGDGIELEALLGRFGDLQAAADGKIVTPDELKRVHFTALRAVESVMLQALNEDQPVRSAQRMEQLIDQLDPVSLLDVSTALYAGISDGGPDLPESITSVSDLIADTALVSSIIQETAEDRPDILASARASALGSTDARTGWTDTTQVAERYALFQPNYPAQRGELYQFEAGGNGFIAAPEGFEDFQWHLDNGVVKIDPAGEMTWTGVENRLGPDGLIGNFNYVENYESIEYHRIVSGSAADIVLVQAEIRRVYDEEELEPVNRSAASAYTAWRTPLNSLPDDAAGQWALNLPRRGSDDGAIHFELTANGMGQVLVGGWKPGETINWEDNGGELTLLAGDNARIEVSFLREYRIGWAALIIERDDTGAITGAVVDMIDKGDLAFDNNNAPGIYAIWGGRSQPSGSNATFLFTLDEDGLGEEGQEGSGTNEIGWVVENDRLVIRTCGDDVAQEWTGLSREPINNDECDQYRRRGWDLIRVSGDDVLVLERFEAWRNNDLDEEPDAAELRRVYFLEMREESEAASQLPGFSKSLSRPIIDRSRDHDPALLYQESGR